MRILNFEILLGLVEILPSIHRKPQITETVASGSKILPHHSPPSDWQLLLWAEQPLHFVRPGPGHGAPCQLLALHLDEVASQHDHPLDNLCCCSLGLCIDFHTQIKMAIILPTGQWYAPSAVINDAWYCMVLHGIALYCIVLHGIAWYCMVFHCIAWYCMVLHVIALYCMILHGIA